MDTIEYPKFTAEAYKKFAEQSSMVNGNGSNEKTGSKPPVKGE